MTSRGVYIAGTGKYLPDKVLTNVELEKLIDTSDEWIKSRSGICERRICADNQATSDLAVEAGRAAIADAGISPEDIDLVVVATFSPDYMFPATACLVQDRLGACNAGAFDLQAACTGFIYGLSVGAQFVRSGEMNNVLVIGAEAVSRILDWQDRGTCVLFGDGAGAVVLRPAEENSLLAVSLGADGSGGRHLDMPAGGSRCPASHDTVEARQHFLKMNGKEIYKFAVKVIGDTAEKTLNKAGLTFNDVDVFIPHQANLRIIKAAAQRFGLPMDKVVVNLDRYGNTSAASIPVALQEAVEDGMISPGAVVLMVGFGAGLTWGSAVLRWV